MAGIVGSLVFMGSDNDARPAGRAKTMRFQNAVNAIMTAVLRSPLAAGPGRALILVHAVGRKSGKKYDVPVAYVRDGDSLIFCTPFAWAHNLRTGEPIDVHYFGKRRTADVEVHSDQDQVVADYALMCRANKNFTRFSNIRLDTNGNPNPEDLRAAWNEGARSYRLTLR